MDRWLYYDVTHRDHQICNPLSSQKLDEVIEVLELAPGARVLDVGCGKAELLVRLAERYGASGDGVDLSPYSVRDAQARARARLDEAALQFHKIDGREFRAPADSYDLAICAGASWTFGGYRGTLQALSHFVRPGGQVLVGEPFWRSPPEPEYLQATGFEPTSFGTHRDNVTAGEELGMVLLYAVTSDEHDWDRYQGLQWRAAERYAADHPQDQHAVEIARRQRQQRSIYLRWERDGLGWGLYLFRSD